MVALLALCAIVVNARSSEPYNKAVGLRLGSGVGIDYKHFVSDEIAMQLIGSFGLTKPSYVNFTGLYVWEWNITKRFYWFIGPGLTAGVYNSNFNVAINGIVGLEYRFKVPLALAADVLPGWYFMDAIGVGWSAALTARYYF